jgi:hypothetical protein
MDPTFLDGEYVSEDEIDPHGHGIKSEFSKMSKDEFERQFKESLKVLDKKLDRSRSSHWNAPCSIS